MILNIPLRSKQDRIEPTRCEVDCVVEIPYDEFIRFRDNPLMDHDFIKAHLDELQQKDYITASCMLVIGKDQSDGILVDPQGYSYARYTAYIPEARQLLQREQSPALSLFNNRIRDLVDTILEKAKTHHTDGRYTIARDHAENLFGSSELSWELVRDMLMERPEVDGLTSASPDTLKIQLTDVPEQSEAPTYIGLDKSRIDLMLARHVLWMHDEPGGERADFSGSIIRGYDFSGRDLVGAIIDDAMLIECDFSRTDITHASFDHTTLRECVFDDVIANSTIFHAAEIREGSFTGTAFEDCDFSDARIVGATDFDSVNYCCIDGTEFIDMEEGDINLYTCYDNRDASLQAEGYSNGPSM
jgi:hypothetical protein